MNNQQSPKKVILKDGNKDENQFFQTSLKVLNYTSLNNI